MPLIQNPEDLQKLLSNVSVLKQCECGLGACLGWESLSESRWPQSSMTLIATLRDPEVAEPTFEEQHPDSTRYDSPQAPVAIKFFPYNRCDVWQCEQCHRQLMRYTEFGGYYVDHRVRELSRRLKIID
jgi:hypothetical protein